MHDAYKKETRYLGLYQTNILINPKKENNNLDALSSISSTLSEIL